LKHEATPKAYKKNDIRGFLCRTAVGTQKTNQQTKGRIMPTYHPGVKNLKQILMQKWSLIQHQPLLKTIYKTPPIGERKVAQRHARQSKTLKAFVPLL